VDLNLHLPNTPSWHGASLSNGMFLCQWRFEYMDWLLLGQQSISRQHFASSFKFHKDFNQTEATDICHKNMWLGNEEYYISRKTLSKETTWKDLGVDGG
jgi:hypothetical protein